MSAIISDRGAENAVNDRSSPGNAVGADAEHWATVLNGIAGQCILANARCSLARTEGRQRFAVPGSGLLLQPVAPSTPPVLLVHALPVATVLLVDLLELRLNRLVV